MNWFANSLNHKFTLATITGFLVSSLVFLGLFLVFYQNELERERAQASRDVNHLLQSSLENAMLKRDLDGLTYIINQMGEQPNISRVIIANPQGQVRFSSHKDQMGRQLTGNVFQGQKSKTRFIQDKQGMEVLRSIKPVHNKPQCKECHGTMEDHPINGILVVDYEASSIRGKARNTTLILMGAGALIVFINLIGGWWFIRRFILLPVESLSAASLSLAHGQLDTRVKLSGKDELSVLGETFNMMATNLQSSLRSLEEKHLFLQAMMDAIPDGLRIIDDDYNMLQVNKTFHEQTGSADSHWVGEKCFYATHDLDEPCPAELMTCPLEEIRKEAKSIKVIHNHRRCDGSSLNVEIYAAPMNVTQDGKEMTLVVESIRDLSQQVRFTHEQRLSELGRLAASVAHEIYNPLSSMKFALNSMTTSVEKERKIHSEKERRSPIIGNYLNIVTQSMEQCIQITDRLLRLSAPPMGKHELVDSYKAVKDILSLVQWDADEASIKIVDSFPEQLLRIFANESEVRMMILNLVQNAFHAMPSGGMLRITGSVEDAQVVLRFEDSGFGISEENLGKIFMPFFSRRADSVEGTGLGLPISRAIVESFDGTLEVKSELGKGSCFIVKVPEASAERFEL